MSQPTPPSFPKTNINIHQQKLYSLFVAGAALVGMILPWVVVNMGGYGGFSSSSDSSNGFGGWGLLTLLGIAGVVVSSLMGDKMQPYDKNFKLVAMSSFAAIILGALVVFIQMSGNRGFGIKTGMGLWLCLLAGAVGMLWVVGIIKLPGRHTRSKI